MHGRYIEEAAGERLDVLGQLVGQPRLGMNDDDYRAWIPGCNQLQYQLRHTGRCVRYLEESSIAKSPMS